jgi:hypothetical protein
MGRPYDRSRWGGDVHVAPLGSVTVRIHCRTRVHRVL